MEHPPNSGDDPDAWRMIRLYDDGKESFWGEASFPLKPGGAIGKLSDKIPCDGIYLRYTKAPEDTQGQGHCTRCTDGEGRWSIFLSLPDEDDAVVRLPDRRVACAFVLGVTVGSLAAATALGRHRG
ncbi:hypothetical protein EMIHUDRAFT_255753 [Emiliania huxleyi CCMP1516]|uniref:Uncharacterized protein n=2 Tax=Emiliania huxleyi TaxID=2903 RepID=A0A0D3J6B1_EMIH1|nr:hypothetical protein EMIHUDRAFT_255753 [Emiliania huxleyi CCMP1516]EOD19046.1 hypothetical protein EMIHUDRAFT_255753 [Emiliania huxleyi CCMP1516]|eukprot:XP_005771475.1 hypothetical protein EMIHUDRAFT_255753 [Emiliania huxleyi CCMP1516]